MDGETTLFGALEYGIKRASRNPQSQPLRRRRDRLRRETEGITSAKVTG